MKFFETPKMDVTKLNIEDIITSSSNCEWDDGCTDDNPSCVTNVTNPASL